MAQLNVHLDDDSFFTFRKIKDTLKCKTNEEAIKKIIDIAKGFYNNNHKKEEKSG